MLRRLTLAKETVAELTTDELATIVGGNNSHKLCISGIRPCDTFECVTAEACLSVVHGAC